MPDICMCMSETCILAETCHRHEKSGTEPCEFRQSYFYSVDKRGRKFFAPEIQGALCHNYWPTNRKEEQCTSKKKN